jgi:cytochrome c-type biogenesis protein CcmF
MVKGDTTSVAGHTVEFRGLRTVERKNKTSKQALVALDGKVYTPSLDRFPGGSSAIGTPSVKTTATEDVYLSLVSLPDGSSNKTVVRVIVQPMIMWLWIGGGVMAAGTALAAFPGRRRRNPLQPASAPVPSTTAPVEPDPDAETDLVEAGV